MPVNQIKLNPERFSKTQLTKRFYWETKPLQAQFGSHTDIVHNRYSYESGNKLYDVDVNTQTGNKTYYVNTEQVAIPLPIHQSIEWFYFLNSDKS